VKRLSAHRCTDFLVSQRCRRIGLTRFNMALPLPTLRGYGGIDSLTHSTSGSQQPKPTSKVTTPKIASSKSDVASCPWGDRPPARPLSPRRQPKSKAPRYEKKSPVNSHLTLAGMALMLLGLVVVGQFRLTQLLESPAASEVEDQEAGLDDSALVSTEASPRPVEDQAKPTYLLQWFPKDRPHAQLSTYRLEWFDEGN